MGASEVSDKASTNDGAVRFEKILLELPHGSIR
jgi:hypothetical protein